MKPVEEYLESRGIQYTKHTHPAVYTCEEAEKHCAHIPGISSKNLLLQDEKKQRFILLIIPDYKRADLKSLAPIFGVKKLSFASPETLLRLLSLTPGSVSPFGLINDTDKQVELIIDRDVWASPIVTFHPNDNTATLELSREMFEKYLNSLGVKAGVLEL